MRNCARTRTDSTNYTTGRIVVAALVLAFATTMMAGCNLIDRGGPDTRKSIVVFIDKTVSTENDRRIFAAAIERLIAELRPGDCIRVAPITESSSRDYVDVVECQLPDPIERQNLLSESTLAYRQRQRRHARADSVALADLRASATGLLDLPSDRCSTAIFETLKIAAQIFAGESRPHRYLVLLSDLVETNDLNFNRIRVDDGFIKQLIERHEQTHVLPDLAGVVVYAVGVGGQSIEHAACLEQFWTRYLAAAGATIPPGALGRALPVFAM